MFLLAAIALSASNLIGWTSIPWYFVVLLYAIAYAEWDIWRTMADLERRINSYLISKEKEMEELAERVERLESIVKGE